MGFFQPSGILNRRGFFGETAAAAPAPSGIPVASTNQISVSNVSGFMFGVADNGVGTYTKGGDYNGSGGDDIRYSFDTDFNAKIAFGQFTNPNGSYDTGWYLGYYSDNDFVHSVNTSSLSGNPNFLPTTGWSPVITITAA
jgi:hypothetical protein